MPIFTNGSIIKEGWLWKQGNCGEGRTSCWTCLNVICRWTCSQLETTMVCDHRWLSVLLWIENSKSISWIVVSRVWSTIVDLGSRYTSWNHSAGWRGSSRNWRWSNETIQFRTFSPGWWKSEDKQTNARWNGKSHWRYATRRSFPWLD